MVQVAPLSYAWFRLREGRFTASTVPSLANLGGYDSQKAAYEYLVGTKKKVFSEYTQAAMKRGQRAESAIALHFEAVTKRPLMTGVTTYVRGRYVATPDALMFDPDRGHYAVEIKCTRSLHVDRWDKLPLMYAVQLHVQMFCMNLLRGVVVASDGVGMRVFWMNFSTELWLMIDEEICAVDRHRQDGHASYPVAQKARRIALAELYVEASSVRKDFPASEEIARKCGYTLLVERPAGGLDEPRGHPAGVAVEC